MPYDGSVATPDQILAVGHWSALDWFALSEVAGLPDVALYPGSMSAWAADPARPVQ